MTIADIKINPKISIIIATLNCERTLKKCLDSIVEQTYPNKEIIILDGISRDTTPQIAQEYAKEIAYFESSPDTGIYHAWNKALAHVTGDWVLFMGADDYFFSDVILNKAVNCITSLQGASVVYGCALLGDKDSEIKRGAEWSWTKFRRKMIGIPHTATFHNSVLFKQYGNFDESFRLAGDYEFLLRVGAELNPVFVNETFVCMGKYGISKTQHILALNENRRAQLKHKVASNWRVNAWYWRSRLYLISRKIFRHQ